MSLFDISVVKEIYSGVNYTSHFIKKTMIPFDKNTYMTLKGLWYDVLGIFPIYEFLLKVILQTCIYFCKVSLAHSIHIYILLTFSAVWNVPCKSCEDQNSCYWQQARWQPISCQHVSHNAAEIKECFKGKKVLFIGDSTNRGIMHYILEKINGSLTDWDKTHDLKMYTSINNKQTTMSFAYYPQFWLPNNHRPGFDKAVYQLIKW